jgi:hypothetical protein
VWIRPPGGEPGPGWAVSGEGDGEGTTAGGGLLWAGGCSVAAGEATGVGVAGGVELPLKSQFRKKNSAITRISSTAARISV